MPYKCAIINCGATLSTHGANLTFHRLPQNENRRSIWLERIGEENLRPCKHIFICSLHFDDSAFNRSLSVIRLNDDAVPTLFIPQPSTLHQSDLTPRNNKAKAARQKNLKLICRICLATNVKLYSLIGDDMKTVYEEVTGLNVSIMDNFPKALCWECRYRLMKCHRFRNQALLTHSLLESLLDSEGSITKQTIKKINRVQNGLQSKLTPCVITENYCDVKILKEETSEKEINQNGSSVIVLIAADQSEIKKFSDDQVDAKKEFSDDQAEAEKEFSDDQAEAKKEFSDDQAEAEKEFSDDQAEVKKEFSDDQAEVKKEFSDDEVEAKKVFNDVEKETDNYDSHDKIGSDDSPIDKENIVKKQVTTKQTTNQKNQTKPKPKKRNKVTTKSGAKPKVKSSLSNLFTITDLTFEEQVQEIEKRKLTDNYKHSEFKCDKCYKGFSYESTFEYHMTQHTDESGKFECSVCKIHFKSKRSMRRHIDSHLQTFQCNQCDYVTKTSGQARAHKAFHGGAKYVCSHCGKVFIKPSTYLTHVRIRHPSNIVCELCGNSFISEKGLESHKNRKHRFDEAVIPDEKHRCEHCDLSFVKEEALYTHLRKKHNIRNRNVSDPDKKLRNQKMYYYRSAKNLIKRCDPEEPVQCELCDASLPDPRAYNYHFRRVHPDKNRTSYPSLSRKGYIPHLCDVCGRVFPCRAQLKDHINIHGGGLQFECAYCSKVFPTKFKLTMHVRYHTAPRMLHPCSICGKTFTFKNNVRRHEFRHTGLRPYKCSQCEKSFTSKDAQRTHFQYVHLKKPYKPRVRPPRNKRNKQDLSKTSGSDYNERSPAEVTSEEE